MTPTPWFKPLGVVVAVVLVGSLIAGITGSPYRSMKSPEGYN